MSRYERKTAAKSAARPELGVFRSEARDDFWADSSSKQLTPAKLGAILREAEDGDISRQCEVFDKLVEDPHIAAVYEHRKRAVQSKSLVIEAGDDSERGRAAAELCEELLEGIGGWRSSLLHLLDALGRGFSVCQIVWGNRGGRYVVDELEWWKQREFVLDLEATDRVRVLTDADRSKGEELAPYQWIVHQAKARSGTLAEAGRLRGLAWAYLFKHSAWRDWVIFSEAYGMPRRVAYYPRGASDEEKRAAWLAARVLGRDAAAALPEGAKLELLKADAATSQLPFRDLIELSDRYISKLILGQTLTTEVGESGGNRALGEVHERVEHALLDADCIALAETLRDQLFAPMVRFNLGDAPIPRVSFAITEDEDLLERAKQYRELYEMGMEFSRVQLRGAFDLDEPVDDEDRLVKPAVPAGAQGALASEADELRRLIALAEEKKSLLDWVR